MRTNHAVHTHVFEAGYRVLPMALGNTVWGASYETAFWAVNGAALNDPPHSPLVDFLAAAGAEAP